MIESGALDGEDVSSLAGRLQIGDRQLRRLFRDHVGAAPVTVAQTRRVLLARQLIQQTNLSMIEVALASGFGSVRRFNETFQHLYQRPPSALRRRSSNGKAPAPLGISLLLPYRSPYDWNSMIDFLEARAIPGLERVCDDAYSRIIQLGDATGSITVLNAPRDSALRAVVRIPRLDALPAVITRIRRMFDLSAEPHAIADALSSDPRLEPLVRRRPGLRVPGGWDAFEIAVRAVLGQQITVRAATQLAGRLVAAIGESIFEQSQIPGLTHAFPPADRFTADSMSRLGIPRSRVAALAGIADAIQADPHLFDPRPDLDQTIAHLRKLPGIGEWTAQYIAMRAMGESDAFPAGDVGLQRALVERDGRPTASQLLALSEQWRPWRAYAVLHLWMSDAQRQIDSFPKEKQYALTA
jgi:AraC family transcriptional regulator of adaptative response / DNA-3-methyladenine glycosylase II